VFGLGRGASVLGRAEDAAVCIDRPGISRRHARIVISGDEATIEDLGSKNGTFRGEDRLSGPVALAEGDVIRLGRMVLVFRWAPSSVSTRTEAEDVLSRGTDPPASR
jgi:pSer/pThr/pTyr-binding forkhead associated (FHA) protein